MDEVWSERYSLAALKLHTGLTHQIRVHMLAIGHPLVSDMKYGKSNFEADRLWCPRNFLHEYHLGFQDVFLGGTEPYKEARATGALAGVDVLDDCRVAEEEMCCNALMQVPKSSSTRELVDVYCPLPEDLCTALAELAPTEKDSGAHLAAWLCSETAKLHCFEQYQVVAKTPQ